MKMHLISITANEENQNVFDCMSVQWQCDMLLLYFHFISGRRWHKKNERTEEETHYELFRMQADEGSEIDVENPWESID